MQQIFRWWTDVLGALARPLVAAWQAWATSFTRLRAGELEALGDAPVLALAAFSLLAGGVARVILAAPGDPRTVAAVASVAAIAWAVVRLGMLFALQPRQGVTREKVLGAWAAGTLVWVIAISPEATFLAWLLSAIVTLAVFERMGVERRYARMAVALAWGLQAAVTAISLVFAGGWAIFASGRT